MPELLLTSLLVVANVLGGGMAFPQAVRLTRTRLADGVSPVWIGVSFVMNLWWLTYGLANELWGLVPVSLVAAVLYAVIAVVYLAVVGRAGLAGIAVGAIGLGSVPLPFLAVGGWPAAGLAVGLCYGMQLAPAVVGAFRSRDLAGIAAGTWVLALVESAIWLLYGLVVADIALLVGGGAGVVMAAAILGRLAVTGHLDVRPAWAFG